MRLPRDYHGDRHLIGYESLAFTSDFNGELRSETPIVGQAPPRSLPITQSRLKLVWLLMLRNMRNKSNYVIDDIHED